MIVFDNVHLSKILQDFILRKEETSFFSFLFQSRKVSNEWLNGREKSKFEYLTRLTLEQSNR